ncbi:MAG: hypothetical protein GTN74_15895 [Proteobacteria bacterium]|nr:hypothetical protein [Pseudomonadota bacterium]NIS72116.1 hypothetical protein [Pseudomonadota bacterium]
MLAIEILPEKNVIDDGFLDLIGREFTTHEQGLAEWLKNGMDATLAAGFTSKSEVIFLRFTDIRATTPPVFECIDFVGMTLGEIERGFKPWGRLARPGERSGSYGGYGMGGKFYMRQMFESSHLITYDQGHLNIFGFDTKRRYGYAQGFRNQPMDPQEALRFAEIESLAEMADVIDGVVSMGRGFSVFRGLKPKGIGKRIHVEKLCERLKNHPQTQRPLSSRKVCVIHNGAVAIEWLKPPTIKRKPGFEKPWVRKIPATLPRIDGKKGEIVRLSGNSESPGTLRLFVSGESLVRSGKMASLNRIDFNSEDGVVGSYRIDELDVDVPYGESIFGECMFYKSGGSQEQYAKKTRDRLVESPETRAILKWVGSQVGLFSEMIRRRTSISQMNSKGLRGKDPG